MIAEAHLVPPTLWYEQRVTSGQLECFQLRQSSRQAREARNIRLGKVGWRVVGRRVCERRHPQGW
jgi:hypothetical protein